MDHASIRLPAILDLGAAAPLWTLLCEAQGKSVRIDASDVERVGGLCLQVLIAAEAQWRTDGCAFAIENLSPAYADGVRLMVGVDAPAATEQPT